MDFLFDVFLCHASTDKPIVRELGQKLRERGLRVWLDEWELRPGAPWQEELEAAIQQVRAAAILYGPSGIGPWADREMRAFVSEFVDRKAPVIPVLLPGAPAELKLPTFLKAFTWVDLRMGLTPSGLDRVAWGVTGSRSGRSPMAADESAFRGAASVAEKRNQPPPPAAGVSAPNHAEERFEGVSFDELVSLLRWDGTGRTFEYWMDRLASTLQIRIEPAQVHLLEQLNALAGQGLVTHPVGTGIACCRLTPMGIWFRRKLLLRRLSGNGASLWA